ncbi:MAG: FAD-dependent oxidoreductase, partial [Candidatus Cloacimonadota bacterium]|nr:FAD-dependent oxidoreductase [Candidatus Cloacimonadota bacterium]
MITIKLNDKEVKTEEEKTILEVANENGIEIPTLCHDSELKPFGSCWVCAVQVKGRKGFVTSCGTTIIDGMEVITDSPEIHRARKMALELLLSDHYADCEAPCKLACPDEVDVQTYVSHIANGHYHEAVKVIKENLPMPLSIGRVCPAFCEDECRRSLVEEPIAIRQLKRLAADFDLTDEWTWTPEKAKSTGEKIAIVGGGPSGLTCGYYLSNIGHDVTVFEAAPKPGGWLRYGIPEYRLPKKILDKEIELMCTNGMKIKTNMPIGDKITIPQLSKEYNAVYLAMGAQKAVPMRAKGSDLIGCLLGVNFLKEHALGNKPQLGKRVAIIGGGNTAIDCARTAKRLGADVTLAYRRTRKEMPAESYEVDAAEEEGIKFYFLTNPVENFGNKKGELTKIKFEKMKLGKPDDTGRRRPEPTGKFFEEKFDTVIAAISQRPDVDFLAEKKNYIGGKEIPLTRWATAEADEYTMYLGIKNIFAGGDFRRGPATAIEAIADGRKAATAIDRYLKGKIMLNPVKVFNSVKEKKLAEIDTTEYEQYEKEDRLLMPELDPEKRATNFKEVELGFDEEDAIKEAKRCLECGCMVKETCDLRKFATDYEVDADLFMGSENKHPIDDSHPYIRRDANKC